MPKYSTTIEIDGEKLKAALVKRGLSFTEASTALGFGSSYISNAIHRGMMSTVASKMLESEFNIRLEDIKAEERPEPEPEPQQIEIEMPAGITYEEIAQAVAEGIRTAFEVIFEEYAIYKVGGVQTIRKRAGREPDHAL